MVKYSFALLLGSYSSVLADQPSHCLREKIYGMWEFHVSKDVENINLFETSEVCTHQLNNKLQILGVHQQFSFAQEEVWKLSLMDEYKVEAMQCSSSSDCGKAIKVKGFWSPIYAQAMMVELENGMRFVTNFRYNLNAKISPDPINEKREDKIQFIQALGPDDSQAFQSQCDQTMVGHVMLKGSNDSMRKHRAQCFYGRQLMNYDVEKTQYVDKGEDLEADKILVHNHNASLGLFEAVKKISFADTKPKAKNLIQKTKHDHHPRQKLTFEDKPSDEMDLLITIMNDSDLGFKMDTCKLQKDHARYGEGQICDQTLIDTNLVMLDEDAEEDSTQKKKFGQGQGFKNALSTVQKWQKEYKHSDDIPDEKIPQQYDFRNIDGYDFTGGFRDQQACGSCYTFGFVQAVQSRLKIKYGKDIEELSTQQILNCNYLVEGCAGGWPHLNAYFMEHAHMVSEKCAPYFATTKGHTCGAYANCQPKAKIQSTHFVGGGFAQVSEDQMMKDILRNGPVSVEFQANKFFKGYRSGIISEKAVIGAKNRLETLDASDPRQSAAQQELSRNLEAILGELGGETDVAKLLSSMGLGDSSLVQLEDSTHPSQSLAPGRKTLEDKGQTFHNQSHTVLIIGWGVDQETQTKYWIIRNSYGPYWGDHGDFKMQRGEDDFGIEANLVSYDPVLCSEASKEACIPI